MTILSEPHLIQLQSIPDQERGVLGVAECDTHVPFKVERIFYQYDMPAKVQRGGHAHIKQEQFLIAMSGMLKIQTQQGKNEWLFTLKNPTAGLFIPAMTWVTIETICAGSICLVLTSGKYIENDYIRDYEKFTNAF
jgi:hypothetical protein